MLFKKQNIFSVPSIPGKTEDKVWESSRKDKGFYDSHKLFPWFSPSYEGTEKIFCLLNEVLSTESII